MNVIDNTVGKAAISQMDELIGKLQSAYELQIKIQTAAQNNNKSPGSARTPGDYTARAESNAATVSQLQANNAEITKQLAVRQKLAVQIEKERIAEIKLAQAREKAVDSYSKAEAKAQALLSKSENIYNKIQAKVNTLSASYNNLAAKRELGLKLSIREEAQLGSLTNRLNKYQSVLIKVDNDIQKNGRSVGNYASAFNGLGNSINQLTREAPAFANSMQTGFLALSNNLPILFDEISKIKKANADLIAQGKPTTSALSQIAGAFFSWGTALSLGVTLLTIYGDEMVEFVVEMFKGTKAIDSQKLSIEQLSAARVEGMKNAQQEIIAMKSNLEIAKDVNLPLKDRYIAVDNLIKQYPYYFEGLTKQQILAGETASAEKALTDALIARATAQAAVGKITENASKIIDLEEERIAVLKRLNKAQQDIKTADEVQSQTTGGGTIAGTYDLATTAATKFARAKSKLANVDAEIAGLKAVNDRLTTYAITNDKVAIGLDYHAEKQKKATQAKRADIEAIKVQTEGMDGFLISLEKNRAELQKLQQGSGSTEEFDAFGKIIKEYDTVIKMIREGSQELKKSGQDGVQQLEDLAAASERYRLMIEGLQRATENYIASVANSTLGDLGMGSLQQFFDGTFDRLIAGADTMKEKFAVTFTAITDVAMEAFNIIGSLQQANAEAQAERLENQYDVARAFAGDDAEAQADLDRQYTERKKKMAREQAEAAKKQAIFNILVSTAQGVVSALASVPPNVPLSIAIGIIGALQAGIVASTPVPQFAEGGIHEGGLMFVNDAKGSNYKETVVTPDGRSYKPQGRNVLMNAPKGTLIRTPEQQTQWEFSQWLKGYGVLPYSAQVAAQQITQTKGIDYNQITNSFISAMGEAKETIIHETNIDGNGISLLIRESGRKTEIMNARFRSRSRNVGRG